MVTEGKKRVRKSPEERKREIIAAAGKLIGEKGYYGTSLKDIADAIGMSQPGLLHYIGNKERLLSLLVTRARLQTSPSRDCPAAIRTACCSLPICGSWSGTMRNAAVCCSCTWFWKPNRSTRTIHCTSISKTDRI